jgi:hypothetical protein
MTPGPTIQDMIATIQADAPSADPLDRLAAAAQAAAALETVADGALTHFVDECRRAGRSWSEISNALGVTKQAAHKRFTPTVPPFERFTPRATAVLEDAVDQARRVGHNFVGTEHVLLALVAQADSVAVRILTDVGVTNAGIEEQITAALPGGTAASGTPPFTPRANACINQAVREADQLGHGYIGTEHLLLALFVDGEALAAKILTHFGATYDDVRARVIRMLTGITPIS